MSKSVMSHQFSQVPKAEIQRSSFDRSHGHKTTFDAGQLIPILVDEALPGDTFNCKMTAFARLATPIFPLMDNMKMETFFFAVPYRLVWDNWKKFNGEQTKPGDSIDYTIPNRSTVLDASYANTLYDYMGLPVNTPINAQSYSVLPLRAYWLIYDEWFRDQNLQDSREVITDDTSGITVTSNFWTPAKRGKRHDYFTSCLPWPQKGNSIDLPLGSTAPIISTGVTPTITAGALTNSKLRAQSAGGAILATGSPVSTTDLVWGNQSGLQADLTTATAATINELRQAFQIQRLVERDARGGTRYTEIIKSHFGVTSPDARLQRPEYLGGGSSPINITPIAQTTSTDATSPQGNLAATGTVTLHNHGFNKSFTEHCIIIGLVNVRADLTYQQGLPRMFSRATRYDFYWPALSHIGEQAVLNKEIYATGTATDDDVFGYQERYAEYRYKQSQITGKFRSSSAASLDAWHLSQDFTALPTLSASFIEDNPPIDRVIAVPSEPHFLFDSYFSMRCARPMPLYGVPGMIDHF